MSKTSGRTATSEDTRSRLLRLAGELFASEGYTRVSVRDLASRLGLTTGAVYSNFRSKGDLLAEILDRRIRTDMERERPDMALPEFVRQSFLRMRERATMRALLVEAATAARTDADLRQHLHPILGALLDRWIADYRDWQLVRHVDRRVDMDALVRSLWAIELGLGVLDAQGALRIKPARMATFVGAYLNALETTDGPRRKNQRPTERGPSGSRPVDRPAAVASARRLTPVGGLRDSARALATQERLIEAALELFATRGYASVSVRDLARATSMTTGSIYGNFANKAVLLVEVIEARIEEDLEQLPASLVTSGSPADLVEFNLLSFDARKQLRALLLEGAAAARADPEVRSRLGELQRGHLNRWAAGLHEWVARCDHTTSVDTLTAVTVVWCAELGQGLLEALDLGTPPAPALARTFSTMFQVAGLSEKEQTYRHPAPRRSLAR